ncbi:formate dehydrogenase accessory sulfurtransferase FdhD [bacterium]|nr:formate dehydrogenase accessory sulfurtransferase FdhD [bacterium]
MATRNYDGKKIKGESATDIVDALTVEEALEIDINNKPFTVSMRTPGDDSFLVRGMLHSEGIIKNIDFLPNITPKKINGEGIVTVVELTIPENELGEGYANSRSLMSVSSCGICGKTELSDISVEGEALDDDSKIDGSLIGKLFNKMEVHQHDFKQSGGTHAAAAFNLDGDLLCIKEDIGRHNAVDKVVGELIISKKLEQAAILTVSGRISYEIIIKCFKANIPFLAAVSAPSSLAVDYAKELGLTLFAFCRSDRATCYSNPQRVKTTNISQDIGNKVS